MKRPSLFFRALHALLLLAMITPPSAFAEDPTASMATTTLQGMNSALGGINGFFSAVGTSNTQLQAMAAQLQQAQQKAQGTPTQQSQFDQIQKNLSTAMVEANNCIQQATPANYDKYYAKRPADQKEIVKNLPPDALTSVEPTCSTYGVILDAIELNKAKMTDANKKMACLTNLQAKITQIAEQAKAPFQSLTDAAGEVYKTHSQIIDSHNKIADKISNDLDGPADKDGKRGGGYRDQLGKLKAMSLELNNVLNAKPGALAPEGDANKQGLKYGLVKSVENLKQLRVTSANNWYFTLMSDVEYCYHNEPTGACFNNDIGNNLSPDQCLSAMVNNQGEGTTSAGRRARSKEDSAALQSIGLKNYIGAQKINLPANIDVTKPDEFLSFTQTRFQATLSGVLGAYREHNYALGLDKGVITQYVSTAYKACYDKAVTNFKSSMISQSGKYYGEVTTMKDAERELANDEKNWIDRVEGQMTEFRTSFHKVYNSELGQFKTDCTAEEDPYKGLDCLRVLNAELQSGIRGTRNATKLSNGTVFSTTAGETVLPIQTLTLDSSGKPSIGNSSVTCSGFDDCINYLDRQRSQHMSAAQTGETDRQKFVDSHNAAVKSSFNIVAQQFSQMSQLLTAAVKGVNDDLVKLGIKATVKTKQIDPEELKENEKTGLINMPKSMKAALAGKNAFTEIDDTKDVTDAYNTMLGDLNKKAGDAQKQKRLCKVDAGDYKNLLGILPDCSKTDQICRRDRVAQAANVMEPLLKKSKEKVDESSSSSKITSNSDYKTCMSEIKSDANSDLDDDNKLNEFALANGMTSIYQKDEKGIKSIEPDARGRARNAMKSKNAVAIKKDARDECSDFILNSLAAQAGSGRASIQQQNTDIIQSLRAVNAACADIEVDDKGKTIPNEDVTDKCEQFKTLVKNAQPPKNEAETGTVGASKSASDPASNPFSAPAK